MSTTVFEALQNAQANFATLGGMGLSANPFFIIAKEQLDNAIEALDNGLELNDLIQEHAFGEVTTNKKGLAEE